MADQQREIKSNVSQDKTAPRRFMTGRKKKKKGPNRRREEQEMTRSKNAPLRDAESDFKIPCCGYGNANVVLTSSRLPLRLAEGSRTPTHTHTTPSPASNYH